MARANKRYRPNSPLQLQRIAAIQTRLEVLYGAPHVPLPPLDWPRCSVELCEADYVAGQALATWGG